MAMEERQTQIKEGAGLDEARINTEFVDLLKKFSTPLLVIVAILAGGFWLYKKREESRAKAIDQSFENLDAATASSSPTSLIAVARESTSAASAGLLARLYAADLHLQSFRSGVPIGAQVGPDGKLIGEGLALLSDDARQKELQEAETLYKEVADLTRDNAEKFQLNLSAMAGLAAIAESRGQIDQARAQYEQISAKAKAAGLDKLAAVMDRWAKNAAEFKDPARLYSADQLASATAPAVPFSTGLQNIQLRDAQGNVIDSSALSPAPAPTPTPTPTPTPAPSPAPAPAPSGTP